MKKLSVLFMLICALLTLTACDGSKSYPIVCDGQVITEGLYNYYLDKAVSAAEKTEDKDETAEEIAAEVKRMCCEYLAAIKLMEKEGIIADSEYKKLTATNTENIWSLFSEYYESIGVTKQDITRVQTHESRLLQLLEHFYGANGKSPVSEADIKEKFVDIYVGFKAIEGSLTKTNDKGEVVSLSKKETREIEKLFKNMAERINNGSATIDSLNVKYNDSLGIIVTSPLSVLMTKKGDPMYDKDFFSSVQSISHGKAKMIKSGTSIYVVERQTIATADEDEFINYRSEILQKMRMPKIEEKISALAKEITIEENTRLINKLIKKRVKN